MTAKLFPAGVLLLVLLACGHATADTAEWSGRLLREVLAELSDGGLPIIYSDELVRPDFIIQREPPAGDAAERLRAVLATWQLALADGPGGSLLVVRQAAPAAAVTEAAASPAKEPLPEVIVTSSVYNLRYQSPLEHTFLDRDLAAALPDVGDEPLRALWRLPGTASGGLSTRQHVRGGLQNEQLFLLDGLRLYEPHHLKDFHQLASIIDQNVIAGIDFYAGGFPARYGDRMSGVVEMELREPVDRRQTEVGLSLFSASLMSMDRFGTNDQGEWLFSARRGNLDLVADLVDPAYGSPRYEDVLLRVGREYGAATHVTASWLYSFDRVSIAARDGSEQARAKYRNSVAWLRAQTEWSEALASDTLVSLTDISNNRTGNVDVPGLLAGSVDDAREFSALALAQRWRWDASERWAFAAGFDLKRLDATYRYESMRTIAAPFDAILDNEAITVRDIDVQPRGAQYAAWLDARWRPWAALFVNAGLRWDQQTYTTAADDRQISPRLQLLYRVGRKTDLRLAAGQYYQAQEINELQVSDGLTDFFPAQRSRHVTASLEHRFRNGVDVRLEVYDKRYRALLSRFENLFDPLVLLPELQIDRVRIDASEAWARGVELTVSGSGESSLWWLSYAYSSVEDDVAGRIIRRSWDQPHTLKGGVTREWREWQFSAAGILHTGWPTSRLYGETITQADGSQRLELSVSPRNAFEHGRFHTLDVRASRRFELPRSELDVFLEVSNLYNRANDCCVAYRPRTMADGTPALEADRGAWLPLVPSIGLLWRF